MITEKGFREAKGILSHKIVNNLFDHGITIGNSTTAHALADASDHSLEVYSSSDSVHASNTVRPVYVETTMLGAGGVGGRAEFKTTLSAALGGWANALKGYTDITTTTGSVSGLGSAVVSELRLPGSTLARGTYAVHEMELVTQENGSYTSPVSFMWCQVSGNATATNTFDDTGYMMSVKGLSEGTGNIFSVGAGGAAVAATYRILIGDTPYFVMLSAAEAN